MVDRVLRIRAGLVACCNQNIPCTLVDTIDSSTIKVHLGQLTRYVSSVMEWIALHFSNQNERILFLGIVYLYSL